MSFRKAEFLVLQPQIPDRKGISYAFLFFPCFAPKNKESDKLWAVEATPQNNHLWLSLSQEHKMKSEVCKNSQINGQTYKCFKALNQHPNLECSPDWAGIQDPSFPGWWYHSVYDVTSDKFFFPALPPLLFPTYFHYHTFYIAYTKKYWMVSTAACLTKRGQMDTFNLGASSLLGKNAQIHLLQQAVRKYH